MQTGTYISGVGHGVLILWAMVGGLFNATPPPPMQVTEVTMISGDEFAALTNSPSATAPEVVADQPVAPEVSPDQAPPAAPAIDTAPETPAPPPPPPPPAEAETPPDTTQIAPLPRADVAETAPEAPDSPTAPQGATLFIDPKVAPKPRPAPRVAPTPAAQPAPEAAPAETLQEAAQPDTTREATKPAEEATAPPEAATEIVTEAEKAGGTQLSLAPSASSRPKSRPDRPAPAKPDATPAAAPAPATETPKPAAPAPAKDAIADAVAAAVSGGAPTRADAPAGPPMTFGEKDALRVSVQRCWNTGALSSEALRVTVTVAVSMNQDGTPDVGTIRQIGAEGGSGAAVGQAFEAARRAIIRCGAKGYDLPVEKYAQWRDIEMVFNPEKMRIK